MTSLVVVFFTVNELDRLAATFANRDVMRERYRCISSRLFTSADSPTRVLSLMEFPSEQTARDYIAAVRLQLDPAQHADLRIVSTEYFDSFANWDEVEPLGAGNS